MDIQSIIKGDLAQSLFKDAVPLMLTDVRFQTNFTGETVLLTSDELLALLQGKELPPSESSKKAKELIDLAKPTLIINSRAFGKRVWAPYGPADAKTTEFWRKKFKFWLYGGLGLLFVTGFTLGRLSKKGIDDDKPRVRGAFGRE